MRGAFAAAVALAGALAACDGPPLSGRRVLERQAKLDPPMLWRVAAVGAPARGVLVCADSVLSGGFVDPRPSVGGGRCTRLGEPVQAGATRSLRCVSGGRRFAVVTTVEGDLDAAFTVRMSAEPLTGGGGAFLQTRSYRRLGSCPPGWRIGDHTDQQGRRRRNAAG